MQFATKPQEATYGRVAEWMNEIFGELPIKHPEKPVFMVRQGSSVTHVMVLPWASDDAVICARAYVVHTVEPTLDLMSYLLHKNNTFRFGAFGLDDDDDVFFEHTIVGSTADKEELRATVLAVASTADEFDDEIRSRFGGETALDRIKTLMT